MGTYRHPSETWKARIGQALAQTTFPLGPLESEPRTWHRAAAGGRKLHTLPGCKKLTAASKTTVELSVAAAFDSVCEDCLGSVGPVVGARVWAIIDLCAPLERFETDVESGSWVGLGAAYRAWHAACGEAAAHSTPPDIRDVANEILAHRRRALDDRRSMLELDAAAEAELRRQLAVVLVTPESATRAAAAEIGTDPNRLFAGRTTYSSSYAWDHRLSDMYARWSQHAVTGDFDAAFAECSAVANSHWDRWETRGDDPKLLAFVSRDFDSPTAWSEAEHAEARARILRAAADTWRSQVEDRRTRRTRRVVVTGPLPDTADADEAWAVLLRWDAHIDDDHFIVATDRLGADRLKRMRTSWRSGDSWTPSPAEELGFARVSDSTATWVCARGLVADGMDPAAALEAARLLV